MTKRVSVSDIERIVGVARHDTRHYARSVSAEQTIYILHPRDCLARYDDLRGCPWSLALDRGINTDKWTEDIAVTVRVRAGLLVPYQIG